jgi:NAD(P)-dependent dehydrogenase (short-subunit alcohol dehydrogenase family)
VSWELAGKTIVLTGASAGIGRALALELAPRRPRLVLAARDAEALAAVAQDCEARGAETLVVRCDVSEDASCRALVEAALERFQAIDALVNNAGMGMLARFEDVTDLSQYERLMRVNYLGSVYPTFHALPHLKRSRGQIVAVSSLSGLCGVPTRSAYAATKHAQIGFFDSLRIELAGSGVDVSVIAPDFVVSEIHKRAIGPDGEPLGESPMMQSKIMTAADWEIFFQFADAQLGH